MLGDVLNSCQEKKPLIHCISNYVSINDCANLVLACGASPIMADTPEETAEITMISDAVVLNLGMLSPRKLDALLRSGTAASNAGKPVIFDPVGVSSSGFRLDAASELLEHVKFSVIRGNASEIVTLANGRMGRRGVDVDASIADFAEQHAKDLSLRSGAVVVVSGDVDIVTDGKICWHVYNGHPMMRFVTGSGCMLSCLIGSYVGASPENPLEASLAAVCAMGLCGEIAYDRLASQDGSGSYRIYLMDAIYHLKAEQLERGASYERSRI